MTIFAPDPIEQAARVQEMHASIFDADDPGIELLAASDNPTIKLVKDDQRDRARVNRRLDELEGAAIAGELSTAEIGQLRKLQARARRAGLSRRYI